MNFGPSTSPGADMVDLVIDIACIYGDGTLSLLNLFVVFFFKGQLGEPLTVYPCFLLCSLGILGY